MDVILSKRSARGRTRFLQAFMLGRTTAPVPEPFRDHLTDCTLARLH